MIALSQHPLRQREEEGGGKAVPHLILHQLRKLYIRLIRLTKVGYVIHST